MESIELENTDRLFLEAIEGVLKDGRERFIADICRNINFHHASLRNVKIGKQHFQLRHAEMLCKVYGVNPAYLMGMDTKLFTYKRSATVNKKLHEISK